METQFGRKPPLLLSLSLIFIIKKTSYNFVLAQTYTSTQAPYLQKGYNLLSFSSHYWKGAPTPWSHLPASPGRELLPPCSRLPATTGRELQPPHWRLWPSAPSWTTFHQFSYWNHSAHLSSTFIKLKLITPSIHSLNHQKSTNNLIFNQHNQQHIQHSTNPDLYEYIIDR